MCGTVDASRLGEVEDKLETNSCTSSIIDRNRISQPPSVKSLVPGHYTRALWVPKAYVNRNTILFKEQCQPTKISSVLRTGTLLKSEMEAGDHDIIECISRSLKTMLIILCVRLSRMDARSFQEESYLLALGMSLRWSCPCQGTGFLVPTKSENLFDD